MKWLLLALMAVTVMAQEDLPPPPPSMVACSIKADLQLIVDSSTTIGRDNFALVKDFLYELVRNLDVSADLTRVAMNRYTSWVDHRFFFNTIFDKNVMLEEIQQTPYYGRGTYTARAIMDTVTHSMTPYNGWRAQDVPTVAIVITDGKSQDHDDVVAAGAALRSKATRVIALGVGPTVSETELLWIASPPTSENVYMVNSFESLANYVGDILDSVCSVENDVNECLHNNGGCQHDCVNVVSGFYCACPAGYTLEGGSECQDINECAEFNGGCSEFCTNFEGGFSCGCSEGLALGANGQTCVADSCYLNDACAGICNNVHDAGYYCSCEAGFELAADGVSCIDIDECSTGISGCEYSCNNTVGSYHCGCPADQGLRADGISCGIICYVCENARNNLECSEAKVCPASQPSCQTKTRLVGDDLYITKQCKQPEACVSNLIQNPRNAVNTTQCVQENGVSVCRCCCFGSYCNNAESCSLAPTSNIMCPSTDTLYRPRGGAVACTGNNLGDSCSITCPMGYRASVEQVFCNLKPRSLEGEWIGQIGDCVDINECGTDNGGCSHGCTNLNGTFECSCPDHNPCGQQVIDLFFLLDSSSSVGLANFKHMLGFVELASASLNVGQNGVRIGVATYNKHQKERIQLNEATSNEDFAARLRSIEYSGRGTFTAAAIEFTADECITVSKGRRPYRPLLYIVITDGRSKDGGRISHVMEKIYKLNAVTFAIGVTRQVNERELLDIAGNPKRYRTVDGFEGLSAELIADLNFCVESEGVHYMTADGKTCDVDECAIDNGGCSDECTNTIGSFVCLCPEGESLVNDGRTCDFNECGVNNGGCQDVCVNTLGGFKCLCGNSFSHDHEHTDGIQCADYDECSDMNGGCSDTCINLENGYECACEPGQTVGTDGLTCEADSCFDRQHPFRCSQTCNSLPGGVYTCSCSEGFILSQDGHNCTEINECMYDNGGCQYDCMNLAGGYECGCPMGMFLAEDGFHCVVKCYTCHNVEDEADCYLEVCTPSETACFTTTRTRYNETLITKGCKQDLACINNMVQGPRDQGEGPSQCNSNGIHSKCDCCCFSTECNLGDCPYANELPTCNAFFIEDVHFRGVDFDGSILPGGVAVLSCPQGYAASYGTAGVTQMSCEYLFTNQSAAWGGNPNDFDVCIDIDECEVNNGGCVWPATCDNYPGGHECRCPTDFYLDYVLIDGTICERDECADADQGGCSHNCTNTIGGFQCYCPGELSLVTDGLTCDFDECRENNGGCAELCINVLGGNECGCSVAGYSVTFDGVTCADTNECAIDNGGCSDQCHNTDGGFYCSCVAGRMLGADGSTCTHDPCWVDNGGCQQLCIIGQDGVSTSCRCESGFRLQGDGTCVDINECRSGIATCDFNCTNTEGGFYCTCPLGTALDHDGKTCGFACYSCHGAATNEECNAGPMEVCRRDSMACENEVRVHGGKKQIFKRCKQQAACHNNQIQNPRQAFLPSQCNGNQDNDVCRCCCTTHMCNEAERVCSKPCSINKADLAIVVDSSSSVKLPNFQIMKVFIMDLLSNFKIGEGNVHVALVRYNKQVDIRYLFMNTQTTEDVLDAVRTMPYKGSGTLTGQALNETLDRVFKTATGMRGAVNGSGIPRLLMTLTDGKSNDDVFIPSERIRAFGVSTYGIGVFGATKVEIMKIAGHENRAFQVTNFEDLGDGLVGDIKASLCFNQNECADENGGCSHTCVDTDGSYRCECPVDYILSADLLTCIPLADNPDKLAAFDECAENNGGCSHFCHDFAVGMDCTCPPHMVMEMDNKTCAMVNECLNNPCEYKCVDTEVGFFCECPSTHKLNDDGSTCTQRRGDGDCPHGYSPLGHTCVKAVDVGKSFASAESFCAADGGRLVKVGSLGEALLLGRAMAGSWIGASARTQTGVFLNSDGTGLDVDNWAAGSPSDFDKCVFIGEDGSLATDNCAFRRTAICEKARAKALLYFMSTWPEGAQARLFWPTGANMVQVSFPTMIKSVNSWFCTLVANQGSTLIFSQNPIEMAGGKGICEFVFQAMDNVPVESVAVSSTSMSEYDTDFSQVKVVNETVYWSDPIAVEKAEPTILVVDKKQGNEYD